MLSYKILPKHFNSQKAYFNNFNKNITIAYTNDKRNSSNYQRCGQNPSLLVMECFRDSLLMLRSIFSKATRALLSLGMEVPIASYCQRDFNFSSQAWTGFLDYQCFHKELSSITTSLIHIWKYLKCHQTSTIQAAGWFLAIENI